MSGQFPKAQKFIPQRFRMRIKCLSKLTIWRQYYLHCLFSRLRQTQMQWGTFRENVIDLIHKSQDSPVHCLGFEVWEPALRWRVGLPSSSLLIQPQTTESSAVGLLQDAALRIGKEGCMGERYIGTEHVVTSKRLYSRWDTALERNSDQKIQPWETTDRVER